MNVGWLIGADGRHEVVLLRPSSEGGPNWHLQSYLPSRRAGREFKVQLPRVMKGVPRPAPTWPPPSTGQGAAGAAVSPAVVPWVHPEPVQVSQPPRPVPVERPARAPEAAKPKPRRTARR